MGDDGKMTSTVLLLVLSAACCAAGIIRLACPELDFSNILLLCGLGMMLGGMIQMGSFLLRKAYLQLHNYSFTAGMLVFLAGLCILIRRADLTPYLATAGGLAVLLLGTLTLQCAVQLLAMKNMVWGVAGIAALAELIPGILIISGTSFFVRKTAAISVVLAIAGAVTTLALLYTTLQTFGIRKRQQKIQQKMQDEEAGEPPAGPGPDLQGKDDLDY